MPDETGDQQGYGRHRPWPPRGSDPQEPVGQAPQWPTSDRDPSPLFGSSGDGGSDWYGGSRSTEPSPPEPASDRFARERYELYGRDRQNEPPDDQYRKPDQRTPYRPSEQRDLFRPDPPRRDPYGGQPPSGQPPYGQGPPPRGPYGSDPYGPDGYGSDPYGRGPDGYGRHPVDPADPDRPARSRPRRSGRSMAATLGLTVLGTLLPGSGLLAAGRRLLGGLVLGGFVLMVLVVGGLAAFQQRELMRTILDPDALGLLGVGLFLLGLCWVGVIVATHRSLRSRMATPLDRIVGAFVVAVLALVVIAPLTVGSRYAFVSRDLFSTVFASEDSKSATRPQNVTEHDPWAGNDRVNILLLGGDGAANRDGIRTDTVMIASIDTETGNTVLFSLPRNLQKLPFPADSPLAQAYPNGVFDEDQGIEDPEYFLNAMYRNVPAQNPGILGETDNEGADVMKLAVGEAIGLKLDYFVLVNLDGFEQIVDAMGGITVNINTRVAIGGDTDAGIPPHDWLEPGPDQQLDGYHALWFARGRYGADDYQRMQRQRCAMSAIIDKARPAELLRRYEAIASASKNIVNTDIPGTLLSAFVDLSMQVKNAEVSSIVFDNTLIEETWEPDYDFIREKVAKAISNSEGSGTQVGDSTPQQPDDTGGANGQAGTNDGSDSSDSSDSEADKGNADPIASSCEYDPEN